MSLAPPDVPRPPGAMCEFCTLRSRAAHWSCVLAALGLPNQCTATPPSVDGSRFDTCRGALAPHS